MITITGRLEHLRTDHQWASGRMARLDVQLELMGDGLDQIPDTEIIELSDLLSGMHHGRLFKLTLGLVPSVVQSSASVPTEVQREHPSFGRLEIGQIATYFNNIAEALECFSCGHSLLEHEFIVDRFQAGEDWSEHVWTPKHPALLAVLRVSST